MSIERYICLLKTYSIITNNIIAIIPYSNKCKSVEINKVHDF